jgi:hypothetical protein
MSVGGGSVEDARAAVLGRLRARQGEFVDAIFERVRGDAFPPVGAGDVEYVAGLRAAVAAAVDYVLEGLERGEGWAGPIPALASEQARRAARIGVPLDTVLRRYMAGQALLGDYIMREAERAGREGVTRELLRVQASLVDRLAREVAQAYSGEREDQAGRGGRGRYGSLTGEGAAALPAMLANPRASRARECLILLAEQDRRGGPGSGPSNHEIATEIGIAHQPQISRLLAQLVAEGLVSKRSQGAGRPNAWRLTPHGEQVARMLRGRRDLNK